MKRGVTAPLAVAVSEALERGALNGRIARGLGRLWASRARASRALDLPRGAKVIGIGGSTLGGSYKTPFVLALAEALAARGEAVSVAASGYGATLREPRRVVPEDLPHVVGDEALWLALALAPAGVAVVSGGERAARIRCAAELAPRVLVDALLQTRPLPLALSILVLDAERPWGAARCPPSGDLRASESQLLDAADVIAAVTPPGGDAVFAAPGARAVACVESDVAFADPRAGQGAPLSLHELGGEHIGLVTAIARPDRVVRALGRAGVLPVVVRRFADHDTPRPSLGSGDPRPMLWLTTAKCATKMGPTYEGAPLYVLRHTIRLPEALCDRAAAAGGNPGVRAPFVQSEPKIALP